MIVTVVGAIRVTPALRSIRHIAGVTRIAPCAADVIHCCHCEWRLLLTSGLSLAII